MLFLQSVIDLFYPVLCLHCENKLVQTEKLICTFCMLSIPKTNFHNDPSNPMIRSLQGRFPVEYACAYMNFNKGGIAQSVLHHLKYKGNANVGAVFGEYFAKEICNHPFIKKADYLIPVPLHKKKLKKRGYNQSLLICNGMQNILQVSVIEALMRISDKETQTHKKRFERWKNVSENFILKPGVDLENKTIVLVDDVFTTGATMEACCLALNKIKGIRIGVATLAMALN